MFDHLRYRSAHVEARSPAGDRAEKQLMLNDERSVEYRELTLGTIVALEEKYRRVRETIKRIERQLASYPERAEQLSKEKAFAESDLSKVDQHLIKITGRARET